MQIFRRGTNRYWAAFAFIYLLTAVGMDLYWLFSKSGPVLWLALLQGKVLGNTWSPELTFLGLLFAELLPLHLLKLLLEFLTGARLTGAPELPPSDPGSR